MITPIDVATAWAKLNTGYAMPPEWLIAHANYFNKYLECGLIIILSPERKEIGRLTTKLVLKSMAGLKLN